MIVIIGMGPEQAQWLPAHSLDVIGSCDMLVGSQRMKNLCRDVPDVKEKKFHLSGNYLQTLELVKNYHRAEQRLGVLAPGDPGFFGILPHLRAVFAPEEIELHPGIGSVQLLFAKAGMSWHDASFFDLEDHDVAVLPRGILRPLVVMTREKNTAQQVAQIFLERSQNPTISVGKNLGQPKEFFQTFSAVTLARHSEALADVALLVHAGNYQNSWLQGGLRIGIPDREFVRGDAPMTKAEIRVQVLSKAQISLYDYILDVGSGTGSIGIEAAAIANEGMVFAIENNREAQQLIRANMRKFAVANLKLVSGTAPEVFSKIPPVNICIINGTRGRLREVLTEAPLVPGGRMVVTAVSLEKVANALAIMRTLDFEEIEIVSLQAVRWPEIDNLHIAQAINPVFIISARKEQLT
ncbi:MAG: precorrin-6y C5,15-methyltransferase (decarboxylating) subunit CbiE [Peptococcaceae bacterium]|nr:precorrin-6y C5,15-methyltransferase (decarboxylating) subunit CbiE [Peptococcaceae bacterium]